MRQNKSISIYFFCLTSAGGAERMAIWLANRLADNGFSVNLISWDMPTSKSFYKVSSKVEWYRLGIGSGLVNKLRRTYNLFKVLRNTGTNVLIGFVMSGDKTVYAAAKLANIKLVVAERNAPDIYWLRYSFFQRWMSILLMHLADQITVQFPNFIEGYPRSLRSRIKVIPNPVTIPKIKAEPENKNNIGKYVLLSVGRLDNIQKRIDLLVEAFANLSGKYEHWDLLIIGDGPSGNKLKKLVKDLNLTDRIHFKKPTINITKEYENAHLFVIPSLWEGFPNALAEALSHGLPSIGFENASGVSELIEESGGGWLVRGLTDVNELALTLGKAMEDSEERKKRGKLATQGMNDYSPNVQFGKWVDMLDSFTKASTSE